MRAGTRRLSARHSTPGWYPQKRRSHSPSRTQARPEARRGDAGPNRPRGSRRGWAPKSAGKTSRVWRSRSRARGSRGRRTGWLISLTLGSLLGGQRRRCLLPHHQHLLQLAKAHRRCELHCQEESGAFAMHAAYGADQEPARKDTVETGGDDGVMGPDVLGAVHVLHDDSVIDHSGDDATGTRTLVKPIERGVVIVDQQDPRGVWTGLYDPAHHTLVREHGHPRSEAAGRALPQNERVRDSGCVAPDHVGRDRIGSQHIAQLEQFGKVAIFGLQFGHPRLFSLDSGELGDQALVFLAHVHQVQVIVIDRAQAGAEVGGSGLDRAQDLEHSARGCADAITLPHACSHQIEREDDQCAAGQNHTVAPQKGTLHLNATRSGGTASGVHPTPHSTVTPRNSDNSSSALPAPITTAVSGSSASVTGNPTSSRSSTSRLRSRAPPPASIMPLSIMSEASSGGVRSSAMRTDSIICRTGSWSASRISSSVISISFGTPATRSRPRISMV